MQQTEQQVRLRRLQAIADLMDSRFSFMGVQFGIDSLIGLVPWVGDVLGGLVSLYIVIEAHRMGAPQALIRRMLLSVVIDVMVGSVPLAGDIFDVFYKVNRQNIRRLERWLADEAVLSAEPAYE